MRESIYLYRKTLRGRNLYPFSAASCWLRLVPIYYDYSGQVAEGTVTGVSSSLPPPLLYLPPLVFALLLSLAVVSYGNRSTALVRTRLEASSPGSIGLPLLLRGSS